MEYWASNASLHYSSLKYPYSCSETIGYPPSCRLCRDDCRQIAITGGGSGIGAATAGLFCREGAKVALVDVDRKKVEEEAAQISRESLSSQILPITADVSSRGQTSEAVSRAIAEFGGLDVLVNNAAGREYFPLAEATEESWQRIIATIFSAGKLLPGRLPHFGRRRQHR
jgi:NAD(P)-dependent dehydrogenase (short-subunit alcohol dehydrogenase family)